MMGYKSFRVKVGLYGNTMDHYYKIYSTLATNGTWYKNVWELVCFFKIRLAFQSKFRIGPVRRGDKSLMSKFVRVGYTKVDLLSLNFARFVHPVEVCFQEAYCTQFMYKIISDDLFQENRQSDSPPL